MKRILIPLFAAISLLATSCATSKFFSGSATDMKDITLIEPYAYITDAFGDMPTEYQEVPSKINQELVKDLVISMGLPVRETISMQHNQQSSTAIWMRRLVDMSSATAKELVVPEEILSAVLESGCRYGMVVSDVGYLKNAKQYNLEKGIETGGKVIDFIFNNELNFGSDTDAFQNGMASLIFDSQSGKVVWFGSQPRRFKKNPVDKQNLTKQINALFKDFK